MLDSNLGLQAYKTDTIPRCYLCETFGCSIRAVDEAPTEN